MYYSNKLVPVLLAVFVIETNEPVINQFEELRKVQPSGPLMNSQFWVGCPTYWKDPEYNKLDVQVFKDDLVQMISMGIGFNLYMFHGGTNFGLTAGLKTEGKYCLTSYDFDAPISESGDLTLKYLLIQKLLTGGVVGGDVGETTEEETNEEISPVLEDIEAPQLSEKGDYGKILFTPVDTLLNCQMSCCRKSCVSLFPKSMEEMNLRDGLMAYTTVLRDGAEKDAELRGTVRDRAYVILNNTDMIGIMENGDVLKLPNPVEEKSKLTFLVENQGRRPYKSGRTVTKGLFNMYLNGSLLDNWVITVFSMNGPKSIIKLQNNLRKKMRRAGRPKAEEHRFTDPPVTSGGSQKPPKKVEDIVPPAFYIGTFTLPQEDEEDNANKDKTHELDLDSEISYEDLGDTFKDSYLDMTGWKKGMVYLNNICLGRYWDAGPQRTLFVPGSFLLPFPWKNKITILELEAASKSLRTKFVLTPEPEVDDIIDLSVPQGLDGDAIAKPSEKEGGGTEGGKAPGGTEVEEKQTGTEAEMNQSGNETEKMQSGTEAEQMPNGTEAEQMPSGTEAEKMPSGTEAEQVLSGADAEKPAEIEEEKEAEI